FRVVVSAVEGGKKPSRAAQITLLMEKYATFLLLGEPRSFDCLCDSHTNILTASQENNQPLLCDSQTNKAICKSKEEYPHQKRPTNDGRMIRVDGAPFC
ncbi:hypothetical protein LJC27_06590, partial [Christensenellaceae bacterium OttesenSCG-928-M15]|nr:hypothetical protein [Christensenellaceae bacterium OttesenSCG-928-M15]